MTIAFFGLTFLLATFFPIGSHLALYSGLLAPATLKSIPPVLVQAVVLLMTYVPAALVTACFLSASKLSVRVPRPVPGRGLMAAGIALTLFYLAARLLASSAEGGGGSFAVLQLSPLVLWPARTLLVVGMVKLLLAAAPAKLLVNPGSSAIHPSSA